MNDLRAGRIEGPGKQDAKKSQLVTDTQDR